MARPLSDGSIEHRVCVAYPRVQGLARNETYSESICRLQEGWEEDGARIPGLRFDEEGYLASPPTAPHLALINEICQRTRLQEPWLPARLKQITLDNLRNWDTRPIFDDVPGWTLAPKAPRTRVRPAVASSRVREEVSAQPICLGDFGALDEDTLGKAMDDACRKGMEEMEAEFRGGPECRSAETLDTASFKHVSVPLRQLGKRHRALDDGYAECWKVFDWHQEGVADTEIARRLWPQLDPNEIRHRVHQRLKTARRLIEVAYSAEPIKRETRRPRSAAASS